MSSTDTDIQAELSGLSDDDLLKLITNPSPLHRDEVQKVAKQVAAVRGLISQFPDNEFKVITAGGRENGPLDISLIKDLFTSGLIDEKTLVFVESVGSWHPLDRVFECQKWNSRPPETNSTPAREVVATLVPPEKPIEVMPPKMLAAGVEGQMQTAERQPDDQAVPTIAGREYDEELERLRGPGGWIMVFIFLYVLGGFLGLYGYKDAPSWSFNARLAELLIQVGVAVVVFWNTSRWARVLTIGVLAVEGSFFLVLYFVLIFLIQIPLNTIAFTVITTKILFGLAWYGGWLLYFLLSRRVKVTYQD